MLDVGCGNGSLLLALRDIWPQAMLKGIDPSRESVTHARAAGIDAVPGRLEETAIGTFDLVISVNVIEHTPAPVRFVESLAAALAPGGTLVLVCPDGSRPSSELVFADHLSSFTRVHLERMLNDTGLTAVRAPHAPDDLGAFQMVVARRQAAGSSPVSDAANGTAASLVQAKRDYLRRWEGLDGMLARRSGGASLICFGIGEAAGLLRAYAPATWSHVNACVADAPEQERFGDLPVMEYAALPSAERMVLLGVRPASQASVAARVANDGYRVIRWDDLIPA